MSAPLPMGIDGSPVNMTRADYTYGASVYGPAGLVSTIPTLPLLALTDEEQSLVTRLASWVSSRRWNMELKDAYYRGENRVQDLGISIPPQMRQLHTAIGWPRVCVDALDERLDVQGFRFPSSTDVDGTLQDIWLANNMDSESQLGNVDALVFGTGFAAVGTGDDPDMPLITVESPLDIAVEWDVRTRTIRNALRLVEFEGTRQATLYTRTENVSLVLGGDGWEVLDRDVHNLGQNALTRIPNRPRSYAHEGSSEITAEIMSITDAACRTLQGLEIAREFYSAPQRYLLGVDSAPKTADGTAQSALETYLGRILMLPRNEDGAMPAVGQFTPYDPATFTKVIDMYAKIISSITGLPPHVLGYTTDNPASADAIRSAETRLKLKADRKTVMFGTGWRDVMKLALKIRGGALPPDLDQLTTVWADTATPTVGATTDAIYKQVTMGYLPFSSDVTGEKLGYSAEERQRIEVDRAKDPTSSLLAALSTSIGAKEARTDLTVARDINLPPGPLKPSGQGAAPAAPTPPAK